jgi:antitoxin ParD1/3/4
MPTRNVNLTEHFDEFIESGVASGRFGNASEMVREGLRLLEQREEENRTKLEWIRSAVREGIEDLERGEYTVLRSRGEIDDFVSAICDEVIAEESGDRARG